MRNQTNPWIHASLDGVLTRQQAEELGLWIQASPANAKEFARMAMLHNDLRNHFMVVQEDSTTPPMTVNPIFRRRSREAVALATAAMMLISLAMVVQFGLFQSPVSAAVEFNRILLDARKPLDRTYLITPGDDQPFRNSLPREDLDPPLNGAVLYVRGPSSYVLTRRSGNGDAFVTGSDGQTSWVVPPSGAVRVSQNPSRFRGALPGQQHNIPFINIQDNLKELANAYEMELFPEPETAAPLSGLKRIKATRRRSAQGGPRYVWIWFEPVTGQVRRMRMDRLPMARGGPRSITLDLIHENRFPDGYFSHEFHHDQNRNILTELEKIE